MTRKQILIFPVICVMSVAASVLCLAGFLIILIPLMIWPGIITGPVQHVTENMTRMFTRHAMGGHRNASRPGSFPMAG